MQNSAESKKKIVLQSKRLKLKQISSVEISNINMLFSESPSLLLFSEEQKREKAVEWVSRMKKSFKDDGLGFFSCYLKNDNTFIGHCGILKRKFFDEDIFELGYAILRRFWNNGYATEAAGLCINFAFESLELKSLSAFIEPGNTASILVAQKSGMAFKQEIFIENKNLRHFTILNTDTIE